MANYLTDRRKELGLTMKEVAEAVGVSEATVSRWESGNIANMKRDKIQALSDVLQTNPTFVMTGIMQKDKKPLTADDAILIKKYHLLSDENKKMVTNLIDAMIKMQNDIAL